MKKTAKLGKLWASSANKFGMPCRKFCQSRSLTLGLNVLGSCLGLLILFLDLFGFGLRLCLLGFGKKSSALVEMLDLIGNIRESISYAAYVHVKL